MNEYLLVYIGEWLFVLVAAEENNTCDEINSTNDCEQTNKTPGHNYAPYLNSKVRFLRVEVCTPRHVEVDQQYGSGKIKEHKSPQEEPTVFVFGECLI